ncbi:hypothetical protein MRX96_010658 [Rhipicephalus microplus]
MRPEASPARSSIWQSRAKQPPGRSGEVRTDPRRTRPSSLGGGQHGGPPLAIESLVRALSGVTIAMSGVVAIAPEEADRRNHKWPISIALSQLFIWHLAFSGRAHDSSRLAASERRGHSRDQFARGSRQHSSRTDPPFEALPIASRCACVLVTTLFKCSRRRDR